MHRMEKASDAHMPMRIARRTPRSSPTASACVASGIAAVEKPLPRMKIVKKNCEASTIAASSVVPNWLMMSTSVVLIASCAI